MEKDDIELSNEEIYRYSRHLLIPEVGVRGQRKLKKARVIIVGAGGLGSPVALYLAAAGIGRIGLVDYDFVDESNLQRQILHSTSSINTPKVESARKRIYEINPYVEVQTYQIPLSKDNVFDILKDYQIVIDGTDNFPTRYLLNDACFFLKKPLVYGSIFRFEGQATVFYAEKGPCYRCLFLEPPPPGTVPSCAEGGVFGVLPGVIGAIQATETIKLILGLGDTLIGNLLLYDALRMRFRTLKIRKNPTCELCSDNPAITQLIDYEAFCGTGTPEVNTEHILSPQEFADKLKSSNDKVIVLDVREPHEWEICKIDKSILIPLSELPHRISELDPTKEYLIVCKVGVRSIEALFLLHGAGLKAQHLRGGLNAYAKEVDPNMPLY